MKTLLFTTSQGNQRALAHKLAAEVPIASIVSVPPGAGAPRKRGRGAALRAIVRRAATFALGLPLRRAWFGMLADYDRHYPDFPSQPFEVSDINAPEVLALVEREKPDLVLVSGTNLLKTPLIDAIQRTGRVLNLHTGISPYIKGGPNCTNWCLAVRRFDLIGNTIMWLDAGIDTGRLVATERTPLTGRESLKALHVAVMEHAHELYVRAVRLFAAGATLPDVPQNSIAPGRLFLSKHWTAAAVARAVLNFRLHYRREAAAPPPERILLVDPKVGVLEA